MPGGRKSAYNRAVVENWDRIMELCGRGATNEEIAKSIGIAEGTLYEYFKRHPDFEKALHEIRHTQIIEVKNALLKKALGYKVERKKRYMKTDADGNESMYTEITEEEVPPDPRAISMWLKNYDKAWSDSDRFTRDLKQQELELRKKIVARDDWEAGDGE